MRANTVDLMAQALAGGLATGRSVVLSRVWMVDETRETLRLLGSAGTPSGGGSYRRLDGDFSRIPLGAGKIGGVATAGRPHIARRLRGDEEWLANPAWAARQGVRAFLAYPLIAGDEIVGVLAVFDRELPSEEVLIDLPFLADVAAARVSDLRARQTPPPALSPDESPLLTSVPAGDLRPSQQPPSLPGTSVPASDLRPSQHPPSLPAGTEVPEGDGGPEEGRRSEGGTEVAGGDGGSVITRAELRWFEKQNIAAALARTGGKIFGTDGAAALLRMKPTTLASRIKALGIR